MDTKPGFIESSGKREGGRPIWRTAQGVVENMGTSPWRAVKTMFDRFQRHQLHYSGCLDSESY